MPRTIEVSVPSAKAEEIIQRIQGMDGVVGLMHQRDVSLDPPGDIVTIQTSNDAARPVVDVLKDLDAHNAGSILTSAPNSIISPQHQNQLNQESNETIWDEMAFLLRQDTNPRFNFLALMALAGAIAAVGLWTDTLHLIVGAMVIAPAFEPLLRIPFGLITGSGDHVRLGFRAVVVGYLMLTIGALLTTLILRALNPAEASSFVHNNWVEYWSTLTSTGVLVSVFGGVAGAIVVSGQRSVLTTGVMITLALVPSLSLVGMAISLGETPLMGQALIRWIVDVAIVVMCSGLVLGGKQLLLHRGRALS
jgi:hypothetical protein